MLTQPLFLNNIQQRYIRRLKYVWMKKSLNAKYKISPLYDRITAEENLELYDALTEKLLHKPYSMMPRSPISILVDGWSSFLKLTLDEQAMALKAILYIFKMGRSSACDLTLIGGKTQSSPLVLTMRLSTWAKQCSDIRIVDLSPSGLFENRSENLLELVD